MVDTYTQALKARKIEPGGYDPDWSTRFNADVVDIMDAAVSGQIQINIGSATTYALPALQNGTLSTSHYWRLNFIGTPASAVTVTVPASVTPLKEYLVDNHTGQALTIKYAATAGVTVQDSDIVVVLCNGTNVIEKPSALRVRLTLAENAAAVTPVDLTKLPGDPERYGVNAIPGTTDMTAALVAANAQSLQAGGAPVTPRSVMHIGSAVTVTGAFVAPRKQCFTTTSDIFFGYGSIDAVLPEWFGAKADGVISTGAGTNSTAAFQAAISATTTALLFIPIHPISCAPGNFVVGNLEFPTVTRLYATGRHTTNFIAAAGTSGAWFTDLNSSAAKIIMEGFAMYGRGLAGITHGIRLGYNGTQHGVEGYIRDLWIQDMPNAVLFDVNGNVGFYNNIATYNGATGVRITGIANQAHDLVAYACTTRGADLNLVDVKGLEIEAPGNSCVPLYLAGNASVRGLVISLANSTTISHLVELAAACTTWEIDPLNLAFGSTPAGVTVSNGNMKRADGTYFGGNATAGSRNGEGNYSSTFAGQKLQSFTIRITNTAGTLQHRITDAYGSTTLGNFSSAISGASATLANTPSGTDSSTAFVSGGKIGSATPSIFWLNVPNQKVADGLCSASISYNSTTTALTVLPQVVSININGVTRNRLGFQLVNASSGAAFGITTGNIGSGTIVQIQFMGHLSQ